MARTTARFLVSALVNAVQGAGGSAMVLARGDETAGSILLVCVDRGIHQSILERSLGPDDAYRWRRVGPEGESDMVSDYLARRRRSDPDLWLVELDIPDGERFAAEMTGTS